MTIIWISFFLINSLIPFFLCVVLNSDHITKNKRNIKKFLRLIDTIRGYNGDGIAFYWDVLNFDKYNCDIKAVLLFSSWKLEEKKKTNFSLQFASILSSNSPTATWPPIAPRGTLHTTARQSHTQPRRFRDSGDARGRWRRCARLFRRNRWRPCCLMTVV